ncbi:MAG: hypothetical protein IKQ13_14325 [Treponema sp.]|nr:hypothetical protein [Treponema sp.]MBR6144983.1 hypothetical protein [Treponema sp.]
MASLPFLPPCCFAKKQRALHGAIGLLEKWQGVLLLSVCPKKKVPQEDDKKKFGLTGMAF